MEGFSIEASTDEERQSAGLDRVGRRRNPIRKDGLVGWLKLGNSRYHDRRGFQFLLVRAACQHLAKSIQSGSVPNGESGAQRAGALVRTGGKAN